MAANSIAIIGGGSAGYFTALFLKKKFPEKSVTVIQSEDIPIIGVGEATTPLMLKFLHETLEFPMDEFFQETKPTLKLGVRFNWGKPGPGYYSVPFGGLDCYGSLLYKQDLEYTSLTSRLIAHNRTPFLAFNDTIKPITIKNGMAYHIDNQLLVRYLRRKIDAAGCRVLNATITDVLQSKKGKSIGSLRTDDGDLPPFDLYFDCSGFKSLLLGSSLQSKWVSYSDSLLTNAAVLGKAPHRCDIKTYTTSSTLNHGWLWETPTQEENHLGYVFSEEFCDANEAREELRKYCPEINQEKVVRFRSGRYENSWVGNVIGIGNAFAFIEPLESTGIHMILLQLKQYFESTVEAKSLADARDSYNKRTNESWDFLRWFIALHFKHNFKRDTPFWQHVRKHADVSGIQDYLDYFAKNGPIFQDVNHPLYKRMKKDFIFGPHSFDICLLGSGLGWEKFLKSKQPNKFNTKRMAFDDLLVQQALSHAEALRFLESGSSVS
jgi:tryptophan halogenase